MKIRCQNIDEIDSHSSRQNVILSVFVNHLPKDDVPAT